MITPVQSRKMMSTGIALTQFTSASATLTGALCDCHQGRYQILLVMERACYVIEQFKTMPKKWWLK